MANELIKRLFTFGGISSSEKKFTASEARQFYDEGSITWMELRNLVKEHFTDPSGRKCRYVCPKCRGPLSHCPDPGCIKQGIGHHLLEEDGKDCDGDVSYKTALLFYDVKQPHGHKELSVDMNIIEKIKRELDEAVQGVLAKYTSKEATEGCEFHGELRGLLQEKNFPETATGWHFQIGDGLPSGWKK